MVRERLTSAWGMAAACVMAIICAACGTLNSPPAPAPYPTGWSIPATDKQFVGVYAHVALANPATKELDQARLACEARDQLMVIDGPVNEIGAGYEHWLYRNERMTLVFSRRHRFEIDRHGCTTRVVEQREVVANRTTSRWPFPFDAGAMRRISKPHVTHTVINGLKAICKSSGDLLGSLECVSVEHGLSKGILLSHQEWTDDFSHSSNFTLDEVMSSALLDAAIFSTFDVWVEGAVTP